MFTGIIEKKGILKNIRKKSKGKEIIVELKNSDLKEGDSVNIDGVCLTVEQKNKNFYKFYISEKTLKNTKFGKDLKIGQVLNVEEPLTLEKYVGGHLIQGHIDFFSKIKSIKKRGKEYEFEIELKKEFKPFIFKNASIAIDGISLTVQEIKSRSFIIMIIPYTFEKTNLKYKKVGDYVNVECDFIIKGVINFFKLKFD